MRSLVWPNEVSLPAEDALAQWNGNLIAMARCAGKSLLLPPLRVAVALTPSRLGGWRIRRYTANLWVDLMMAPGLRIEGKIGPAQIAHSLGLAPNTHLVTPRRTSASDLERIRGLGRDPERIVRPAYSSMARKVQLVPTPEAAFAVACRRHEPTLVQTVERVDVELRVLLHRTPQDLKEGLGPSVRLAFVKLYGQVVGDGRSTAAQLIEQLPASRRHRRRLKINATDRVLPTGEVLEVPNTAGARRICRARLPNSDELAAADRQVLAFLRHYEDQIGCRLATVCLDIGLRGPDLAMCLFEVHLGLFGTAMSQLDPPHNTDDRMLRRLMDASMAYMATHR